MKTPPFLLGAAVLFWAWQTGFLLPGILMALVLEGARWVKLRWDFSEQDFTRIWLFCSLLLLASVVYAFTTNQGPSDFRGLFISPTLVAQRNAGLATARTTAAVLRWLPMLLFLFVAAQIYSTREGVPLEVISMILRKRWKKARQLGHTVPGRNVNLTFPYFTLCLFAASVHVSETSAFFWGLCALLAWALWPQRPRRFAPAVWILSLGSAISLGYLGQRSVGQLQRYLGNLNPQWLQSSTRRGFDPNRSRTAIGHLGRLKTSAKIVLRVQAKTRPVAGLLRAATYRTYTRQQTWISVTDESDFQIVHEENTNREAYVLLPSNKNSVANIACYLPEGTGVLPLPQGSSRLEHLFAYTLKTNELGTVWVEGPGLVIFDAIYGPGISSDAGPDALLDTDVPPQEIPALDQVIEELHWQDQNPAQKVRTLNAFFLNHFAYSTWQDQPARRRATNDTPLTRFLLRQRSGHCEYFATAAVLLLRRANIPARYAVGFAVHEGTGSKFIVRERDAHSWCLVWDQEKKVWQEFDPTPGTWVQTEAQRASPFQAWADAWSWVAFQFAKLRWGQTNLRQYVLWAMVPVLAFLLFQIIFQSGRRRRAGQSRAERPAPPWPGLDSEFYELERILAGRGLPRNATEPLSEWLKRTLKTPALATSSDPLQNLLRLHYRYRFDPRGLSPLEREQLRRDARLCLERVDSG